jgi:hypothetical protein
MSLDLVVSQPHDFAGRQRHAVQAEAPRIDAEVAPALIALGQVEELAHGHAVTVEIHLQRRLLGTGERPGEVARAMEEIVDAARKRRVVGDRQSDLGSYLADMGHVPTIRRAACALQAIPMYSQPDAERAGRQGSPSCRTFFEAAEGTRALELLHGKQTGSVRFRHSRRN